MNQISFFARFSRHSWKTLDRNFKVCNFTTKIYSKKKKKRILNDIIKVLLLMDILLMLSKTLLMILMPINESRRS